MSATGSAHPIDPVGMSERMRGSRSTAIDRVPLVIAYRSLAINTACLVGQRIERGRNGDYGTDDHQSRRQPTGADVQRYDCADDYRLHSESRSHHQCMKIRANHRMLQHLASPGSQSLVTNGASSEGL